MNERDYDKVFKFSLYQQDVLLGEKIFDAEQFNPFTRYSINIRDILPRMITKFQKMLSRKSYEVEVEVGREDITNKHSALLTYNIFGYHQQMINSYPKEWHAEMRYRPKAVVQRIEEQVIRGQKIEAKTIRGVECKLGLYINDHPIVERMFYVDGYNPVARYSVDLNELIVDTADLISNQIKKNDIRNMWDDYDLINERGLSITQIRELHPAKRAELIRRLSRNRN